MSGVRLISIVSPSITLARPVTGDAGSQAIAENVSVVVSAMAMMTQIITLVYA